MAGDHQLGAERPFVDLSTGEVVMERPVLLPVARAGGRGARGGGLREQSPGFGFVVVSTEALWAMRLFADNSAALLLVIEAARQKRMNGGGLKVTATVRQRYGLTPRAARTALNAVAALAAETGWVKVHRSANAATIVEVTDLGLGQIWHGGRL